MKTTRPAQMLARVEALESRIAPATIYGLTDNNQLLQFDSDSPNSISSTTAITGLGVSEILVGIDVRPATGELYALSLKDIGATEEGRLYTIDPSTGVATQVGDAPFSNTLSDNAFWGFDFNPVADRIRVVSSLKDNLRLNPNNGTLASVDTNLDNPGDSAVVTAVAYDQNITGTAATTLFGLEYSDDQLVLIGGINGTPSPNGGVVSEVGDFGGGFTTVSPLLGFDIYTDLDGQHAFASAKNVVDAPYRLFKVNLSTGQLTEGANIGNSNSLVVTDIAAALPAVTVVNAKTVRFTDVDGDIVTITTTKGSFDTADFGVIGGGENSVPGGMQLARLNLDSNLNLLPTGNMFQGASITITAKPGPLGGDGFVNVGAIEADGLDLASVKVRGDLGQINAGDLTRPALSIGSLRVESLGHLGLASQGYLGDLSSDILGKVGSISIRGSVDKATINVTGNGASISKVTVGGSIIGGATNRSGGIFVDNGSDGGDILSLRISGDIVGGSADRAGAVDVEGMIRTAFVGGCIFGGSGESAGLLEADNLGNVTLGHHLYGGSFDRAGSILGRMSLGKVTVLGSVIGGTDFDTGIIYSLNGPVSSVNIRGDIVGGDGGFAGAVYTTQHLGNVTIGGSIIGGGSFYDGSIFARSMGSVVIKGDLAGGSGSGAGMIYTNQMDIASIKIGGSLIAGTHAEHGIYSSQKIGSVVISGDLRGNDSVDARISARGMLNPESQKESVAIGGIKIGRDVMNARILAGYLGASESNPNASINSIAVKGDWIASDLIAGINATNGVFGDNDDVVIAGDTKPEIFATIAKITIGGQVLGTEDVADVYGIEAQRIGSLRIGTALQKLKPYDFLAGTFRDTRVNEI